MGPASSKQRHPARDTSLVSEPDQSTELQYLFLHPDTDVAPGAPAPGPVPTVLCFHGSGHGSHREGWLAVVEAVAQFAPVLYYDRRGVSSSSSARRSGSSSNSDNNNNSNNNENLMTTGTLPSSSLNQTPEDAVKDLQQLLRTLNLRAPYILLAHSYGGAIARTFLQACRGQVAGAVLAETGQETPTRHDEEQYRRRILGGKPLSVIHAVLVAAAAAAAAEEEEEECLTSTNGDGGGDGVATGVERDRRRIRQMWAEEDERLKKAQLRLSSNARYVRVDGCGHDVVRQRPDVVAEEVRWVFETVLRGRSSADDDDDDDESSGLGRLIKGAAQWLSRRMK